MKKSRPKIVAILGPTATGKTKLAVRLASRFNGEIVSADSRQIYRGMTVGTGKDLKEFSISNFQFSNKSKIKNQKFKTVKIPYHLIDVVNPKTEFNVAKWLKLTRKAIDDILARGKVPFIVGGTGLYISALVYGYNLADTKPDAKLRKKLEKQKLETLLKQLKKLDPKTYQKIDKKNKRRVVRAVEILHKNIKTLKHPSTGLGTGKNKLPTTYPVPWDFLLLGVKKPREEINKLIDKRVDERLKQGMIAEVTRLHKRGVSWKRLDGFGLEYRFLSRYLRGQLTRGEMTEKLKIATHQFAKRQMTWFKRINDVRWVEDYSEARKLIQQILAD